MIRLNDIKAYIQGNIRYKLYYSKYSFLIPLYIREQIQTRIVSMNIECFNQGSCIKCGCRTTHLQMANKKCDGDCYPVMMNRNKWEYMKKGNITIVNDQLWKVQKGTFKRIGK